MTDDPEGALLAAVQANRSDLLARQVYADWLEERGDPRGEYLRLEEQLVTLPSRVLALAARLDQDWLRAVHGRFRVSILAVGTHKILAIKLVRELTGLGLKDAKDLVESVPARAPVLLRDDIDLDEARAIVEKCASAMTLGIEPRLPTAIPLAPAVPRGDLRAYRVMLVGVTDRLAVMQRLRDGLALSLSDARDVVDRIVAGQPLELARGVDAGTAAEAAASFGPFGAIRIEHA